MGAIDAVFGGEIPNGQSIGWWPVITGLARNC